MRVLSVHKDGVQAAIEAAVFVLRAGGIVVYPTETTYGIGVDVENPAAVQKLLAYKGKRDGKAISVAVADKAMAQKYVRLNMTAERVYANFLPGPVTVVSTGTGETAHGIASTDGKVGIRIPKYDLALKLIASFGHGISATGANTSNKKRPYSVQDILDNTTQKQKELIDLIVDVGELPHNEPSTVIDTTLDDIVVLRSGPTMFESAEQFTTHSVQETIQLFENLTHRMRSYFTYTPVIFALEGPMGAGKTHGVKGIAKGLGITHHITSPTYTLSNEYTFTNEERPGIFVHIDAWRMKSFEELEDLGFVSYLAKNAVFAIEWSEKFEDELKKYSKKAKVIFIRLLPQKSQHDREVAVHFL